MMYKNYGDKNFFEYGLLVNVDNDNKNEVEMLICRPYNDEEDLYQFGHVIVNIDDKWIDKERVMSFIGMDKKNFDKIEYAIGCVDYYGAENFGIIDYSPAHQWNKQTRKEIEEQLKYYNIASDNLDITW